MSELIGVDESASLGLLHSDSVLDVMQRTLAGTIRLTGIGIHSGLQTTVVVHPAAENIGIVFRDGKHESLALATSVVDTSRGTSIGFNGICIRTIEHLMSALRGCGVDNAVVEVSGSELPALDGSALPYVMAIDGVGLVDLGVRREAIHIKEPICVKQNDSFVLAVPAERMSLTYVLSYNHPMIGSQTITYSPEEIDYAVEIAPARTFVLREELDKLLEAGLSQGGSLDNAIVVGRDSTSSALRFPDELGRHKLMDLIGDVSLIGGLLQAEVLAVKSGHALNVEFAREVIRVKQLGGNNLATAGEIQTR